MIRHLRSKHIILFITCATIALLVMTSMAQDTDAPNTDNDVPPMTLSVWWPDVLASLESDAYAILTEQTEAFVESESNVNMRSRLRRVGEPGGIMSTMRSASVVAPGALPDVTLLRRSDLIAAQRDGLIQPLERLVPSGIVGSLSSSLPLGQIDNELYGVPYVLNLQHLVYHEPEETDTTWSTWSFDDVLAREQTFIFPAGRITSVNDVFLTQYLKAGGTMSRDRTLTLNPVALRSVLTFYENAKDAGLIDGFALNYITPSDYLSGFRNGNYDLAVFSSETYLQLKASDDTLRAATIPTPDGNPASILNGWMWVIVTTDPNRQEAAMRYITWMMNNERQVEYALVARMLPSQNTTIGRTVSTAEDAELYNTLLDNAILPLTEGEGGTLARLMQDALQAVLTGEQSAEDAAQAVIEQATNNS